MKPKKKPCARYAEHAPPAHWNGDKPGLGYEGAEYTPEEVEFLRRVEKHKCRTGDRFPPLTELFRIAREVLADPPRHEPPPEPEHD